MLLTSIQKLPTDLVHEAFHLPKSAKLSMQKQSMPQSRYCSLQKTQTKPKITHGQGANTQWTKMYLKKRTLKPPTNDTAHDWSTSSRDTTATGWRVNMWRGHVGHLVVSGYHWAAGCGRGCHDTDALGWRLVVSRRLVTTLTLLWPKGGWLCKLPASLLSPQNYHNNCGHCTHTHTHTHSPKSGQRFPCYTPSPTVFGMVNCERVGWLWGANNGSWLKSNWLEKIHVRLK